MPEDKNTKAAASAVSPATATPEAASKRFIFTDEDVTIALEFPIALGGGEQVIDRVTVRKPRAGEMRGLSMFEVMHMDTDTIVRLLPRISRPAIHKIMAEQLDPADLANISKCISGFFNPKKQRAEIIAEMEAEKA